MNIQELQQYGVPWTILSSLAGQVLHHLLPSETQLSCDELAARTGTSAGLILVLAEALVERRYVHPAQPLHSAVDPGSIPMELNAGQFCALGVKVLPDKLLGIVTDLRAQTRYQYQERQLDSTDADSVIHAVAALCASLRGRSTSDLQPEMRPSHVIGLGVELGGHVDGRSGEVLLSPNLQWPNTIRLGSRLREATGFPTVVENDVNALAVYSHLFGEGVGTDWFGVILLADGIGCGLILDGRLAHGASGLAGELGHIVIDPNSRVRCLCRKTGCLETVASTRAIVSAVRKHDRRIRTFDDAVARATTDERAQNIFASAGSALGQTIAALLNIVNLEQLLIAVPEPLGNRRGTARRQFEKSLRTALRRYCFSTAAQDCNVTVTVLPAPLGAHGAASTVVRRFIARPLQWDPVEW